MLDWIKNMMTTLGYPGVTFLMFLENIFPPLPSELIMPLAGFATTDGQLSLIGVSIAGTLGSVLGALPLYALGRWVGKDRLVQWADRYGKWLTVSGDDICRADDWLTRHGTKAVFFCRLVPGIRSLISIPAGMSTMNVAQFLLYTALGAGIWTAALAYGGRALGNNYELIDRYLGPLSYVVLGGLVLGAAIWVWQRRRDRA